MRTLIATIAATMIMACTYAQSTISKEFPASNFSKIKCTGVMNVILIAGETEGVKVETTDKLMKEVKITQNGDLLLLETENSRSFKKGDKVTAYITFKKLSEIRNDGVGNISNDKPFSLNSLLLSGNGVGNVNLNIEDAGEITMDYNGVGNMKLKGHCKTFSIKSNGVGNVECFDMNADVLKLDNNGVGNVEVFASNEIYMKNSGVGNVKYKGPAKVMKMENDGVGKMKKVD